MIYLEKKKGNQHSLGYKATSVRLEILGSVIMPNLLYAVEMWTNLKKKGEMELQ